MAGKVLPRYPIYVPSKGRSENNLTARFLIKDGVPFRLVVEPQEAEEYGRLYGENRILVLPWDDPGSVIPARNWIKEHAIAEGHARHWQLDDNMYRVYRWYKGQRIQCDSGPAFAAVEDFVDRYTNVALAGMNYEMFGTGKQPPFHLNCRVYSCSLVNNEIPHMWRGMYNEDADMCLQVLADGWCTVLTNVFLIMKRRTMRVKGGNTQVLYQGDGRLKMARSLERLWPGVVTTKRRFHRAQHVVKDSWKRFDTPLKLKEGVDLEALKRQGPREYGMRLRPVEGAQVESDRLKKLMAEQDREAAGAGS
jgi:hypothetical protein